MCLAIFRPGIIVGNAHTGLDRLVGRIRSWAVCSIDQRIVGRSIAAEIALHSRESGEVTRQKCSNEKTRCAVPIA
jgi:hypothetical protein